MKKVYNVESVPSVQKLSEFLNEKIHRIDPNLKTEIYNVLEGTEKLDAEVKLKTSELQITKQIILQKDQVIVQKESVINQKTVEIQNTKQVLFKKDQIIAQKEQSLEQLKKNGVVGTKEEFIYLLNKLSPEAYSADFSKWSDKLPMKKYVDENNIQVMEKNIAIYKPLIEEKEKETIKKEFVKSLNELYPDTYSTDPNQWFFKTGEKAGQEYPMKTHYDNNNFYVMVKNTATYKKEIEEINTKKLEDAKRLKEEEEARKEQLLNDNHREIEDLKALIAQKELEKQEVLTKTENVLNSKDQLLVAKDNEMESLRNLLLQKELETQELLAQQEIEKQELLAQKEAELHDKLHDKSLVKNQVIGELHGALNSQEKEAYKLQIELLTKQLAFKEKESEFKDKALENALEIGKQNKIISELKEKELADAHVINELQGKLLAVVDLHKDGKDMPNIEVLKYQVNESILSGDIDEMKEFSKYLSELMKNPIEKDESLEISELLNNLSPIVENPIQHPIAVVNNGNFDIDQMHVTHSVLLSGSVEFSIIEDASI